MEFKVKLVLKVTKALKERLAHKENSEPRVNKVLKDTMALKANKVLKVKLVHKVNKVLKVMREHKV